MDESSYDWVSEVGLAEAGAGPPGGWVPADKSLDDLVGEVARQEAAVMAATRNRDRAENEALRAEVTLCRAEAEVLRAEAEVLRAENEQLRADLAAVRSRLRDVGFTPKFR